MSEGLIEFLKAKKIQHETGKWPVNKPAFSEDALKAVLEQIAAIRDCA